MIFTPQRARPRATARGGSRHGLSLRRHHFRPESTAHLGWPLAVYDSVWMASTSIPGFSPHRKPITGDSSGCVRDLRTTLTPPARQADRRRALRFEWFRCYAEAGTFPSPATSNAHTTHCNPLATLDPALSGAHSTDGANLPRLTPDSRTWRGRAPVGHVRGRPTLVSLVRARPVELENLYLPPDG